MEKQSAPNATPSPAATKTKTDLKVEHDQDLEGRRSLGANLAYGNYPSNEGAKIVKEDSWR